ncbi:MAG TPA: TIGR03619 family F420-dependent LLM class oxidoreductase [Acidimicrobiales bacterium]
MVEYGMQLPVQAQSKLMAFPWEEQAGPAEIAAVAAACERNGFGYVGVCDHVAVPRELAPRMTTIWYDTVATLSWLAARTERIKLLSHVFVLPYRHPLVTAKSFMTLDALSGGRAILGVGAGHAEGEFVALGIPFAERGRLTDEAITVIKASFADEWGAGDVGQAPRPVQPGGPPVWVGGSSKSALLRAARLGDGWLPQGPPPMGMEQAITLLRDTREQAGRADAPFAIGGGFSFYVGEPGWDIPEWTVRGEPEKLAEQIAAQVTMGVTHVQVRPPSRSADELIDQIEAFGQQVAPLVST